MERPTITHAKLAELEASGHCVHIYPRLREACVDGFKYYRIIGKPTATTPPCNGPSLAEEREMIGYSAGADLHQLRNA